MKAALGDYRAKMKEEEKKMALGMQIYISFIYLALIYVFFILAAKQIKFTQTIEANKKSSFLKKAAFIQTGKEFRFNFSTPNVDDVSESTENDLSGIKSLDIKNENGSTISKDLHLTGGGFKFNFIVNENNDDLNLSGLSIKS